MYRRAISRFLPISDWLPDCTPTTIRADVIAGIALAGLLCPGGNGLCGHVYLRAVWDIASARGYACIIIGSHAGRSRSSDCRRRLLSICCARFRRRYRSWHHLRGRWPAQAGGCVGVHFQASSQRFRLRTCSHHHGEAGPQTHGHFRGTGEFLPIGVACDPVAQRAESVDVCCGSNRDCRDVSVRCSCSPRAVGLGSALCSAFFLSPGSD